MHLTNNDKLINLKYINIDGIGFKYCDNVLLSLGLSKEFILFKNHYFFGFRSSPFTFFSYLCPQIHIYN